MHWKKIAHFVMLLCVTLSLSISGSVSAALQDPDTGGGQGAKYATKIEKAKDKKEQRTKQIDREKAAAKAYQRGMLNPLMRLNTPRNGKAPAAPEAAAVAAAPTVWNGTDPRYFSHPNYANSPLPTVDGTEATLGNALNDRAAGTDARDTFVVLTAAPLPEGFLTGFQVWNQAGATPSAGQKFHAYVLRPTVSPNVYQVMFDSGLLTVPGLTVPGVSEAVTYGVANLEVHAGDLIAFYGRGVPVTTGTATDWVSEPPVSAPPLQDSVIELGAGVYPNNGGARTYSFAATVFDTTGATISGGIRKFVDTLPGLTSAGANNLGQYVSVATPNTSLYAGSDYYEIGVVQYREKMHSDLPPTLLRGYVELTGKTPCAAGTVELFNAPLVPGGTPTSTGYCSRDVPHYLGATISATKDRPVRILFRNLLPTGQGGDLFVPTDVSVMGAGMGPTMLGMPESDPKHPTCGQSPKPEACYTENRAVLHLHGGRTPWISDGTPHQWITPWGERPHLEGDPDPATPVIAKENKGDSVAYVPDMWYDANGNTIASCAGMKTCGAPGATNYPGNGSQTYYYTNQQSARMLFYHDHSWGITRLNVYVGEAAGYLITDDVEQMLIDQGIIPAADATIPLIVQDKTFVPSEAQRADSDETWNVAKWGDEGNLWLPHVYSPAQNPGDASGVNQYGRWAYGPWFWPPTNNILYGPTDNPYYDPACDPDVEGWCEPQLIPGTPYNSMGMEAFHDTPVVNGTAYPTVTVEPKAYRFRVLNAASDRFFNLSLYKAVDANGALCDAANANPASENTGVACTEVALNPTEVSAALLDPTIFPTPLAGTEGPAWIQFGTEGGFLPAPTVLPAQPTTWVNDPTVFNAGNVDQHSLLLGPAERAEVVVDFSQFAGQTLILYNDAPAAFPARDPRYDYYTGNGNYVDTGGAPSTLPGYGPNTRTVMQIKVQGTPAAAYNVAALESAFQAESLGGMGVFENGQDPIIVGQGEYNSAYGTSFPTNGPGNGTVQIYDTSLTFNTLSGNQLTMPMMPKQIQDEMGEAFDHDYGRMSGFLGVESPNPQAGVQNMILYPYVNPASELINLTGLPMADQATIAPIASADDGTQIWKITHNGVDTHPIHFHLYDVQVLNRVGWDGIIRKPDANELGWKDTVRISPLEDTIVALRPVTPVGKYRNGEPFDLPNSIRRLNPAQALGSSLGFNNQDAWGNPTSPITNDLVNFGWEYVWHCHILSHEEMDMMRPQAAGAPPKAPSGLTATPAGSGGATVVNLAWTDNSKNDTGFKIQRRAQASPANPWTDLAVVSTDVTTYTDTAVTPGTTYEYQVWAVNKVGYAGPAAQPGAYSTLDLQSSTAAAVTVNATFIPPPTNVVASCTSRFNRWTCTLIWSDPMSGETGYRIQRATNANFTSATTTTFGACSGIGCRVTYTGLNPVAAPGGYYFRIQTNVNGTYSNWANATPFPERP
jgi:FtsP/CotA-like multicopper oxidase with cupredoxin domain